MTIILDEYDPSTNYIRRMGGKQIALAAGQWLKIETSPDGEELLNVQCPTGKTWGAIVYVNIRESDA